MEYKVSQENIGSRLDIFLTDAIGEISRSQWQKRIKAGEVLVNGKPLSVHYKLKSGDKISVIKIEKEIQERKVKDVEVVFKDDDYLVINKPVGVVVHENEMVKGGTLANWLFDNYPEVGEIGDDKVRGGIVHRLDKDVSGLMVVARNQEMFDNLKRQFKERKIAKEYIALVHGMMRQDEGEVKLPIGRSKNSGIFVAMGNILEGLMRGKEAVTKYEVIKKFKNFTLVKVKILTGRTHQIRVHLRSIGHGVVGDKLYATHDVRVKKKGVELGRLWLYAAKLGFNDLEGEWVEYEVGMPEVLNNFIEKLK